MCASALQYKTLQSDSQGRLRKPDRLYCAPPAKAQAPTASDPQPAFRVATHQVLVPVVARDRSGRAVGNLTREDFRLSTTEKAREITKFSVVGGARSEPASPGQADEAHDRAA